MQAPTGTDNLAQQEGGVNGWGGVGWGGVLMQIGSLVGQVLCSPIDADSPPSTGMVVPVM